MHARVFGTLFPLEVVSKGEEKRVCDFVWIDDLAEMSDDGSAGERTMTDEFVVGRVDVQSIDLRQKVRVDDKDGGGGGIVDE